MQKMKILFKLKEYAMDYLILKSSESDNLQLKVNDALEKGYVLNGVLYVVSDVTPDWNLTMFYQAVVKL